MNKKILEIAFYIAGRGFNGTGYTENEINSIVKKKTDLSSFKGYIKDFRVLLSNDSQKRAEVSEAICDVHNQMKDTTATNIRKVVINNLKEIENGEA